VSFGIGERIVSWKLGAIITTTIIIIITAIVLIFWL